MTHSSSIPHLYFSNASRFSAENLFPSERGAKDLGRSVGGPEYDQLADVKERGRPADVKDRPAEGFGRMPDDEEKGRLTDVKEVGRPSEAPRARKDTMLTKVRGNENDVPVVEVKRIVKESDPSADSPERRHFRLVDVFVEKTPPAKAPRSSSLNAGRPNTTPPSVVSSGLAHPEMKSAPATDAREITKDVAERPSTGETSNPTRRRFLLPKVVFHFPIPTHERRPKYGAGAHGREREKAALQASLPNLLGRNSVEKTGEEGDDESLDECKVSEKLSSF